VRRLHDTGRPRILILIALVPFVGGIILLVFTATEGNRGPNQYGPDPKMMPAPGQQGRLPGRTAGQLPAGRLPGWAAGGTRRLRGARSAVRRLPERRLPAAAARLPAAAGGYPQQGGYPAQQPGYQPGGRY
jgi:hypothetical protein